MSPTLADDHVIPDSLLAWYFLLVSNYILRTTERAKEMAVNLKKNEAALLAAYNDVLNDSTDTNW